MGITNYHTHTAFCDGKDTPSDVAREAYRQGLSALGFSAHAWYPVAEKDDWHINPAAYTDYVNEVRRLKDEYAGRMEILCGFEADYISGIASPSDPFYRDIGADYVIGSVHYLVHDGGYFTVDGPVEEVRDGVKTLYKGDAKAAVCEYFELQRLMLRDGGFEIWAHGDLFRKRNGVLHLFNERDSWYREQIAATAKEAARSTVIAEINTGGMARGAMDDVYPSAEFLHLLHEYKVPVIISSDAHRAKDVAFGFDKAMAQAMAAGYEQSDIMRRPAR